MTVYFMSDGGRRYPSMETVEKGVRWGFPHL